ncbi:hypothetical protein XENOCAPTIV_011517, partial [Xenoophorus captivus]
GEITEDDLAVILEIMLGVKEVELSPMFLQLQASDMRKITYGGEEEALWRTYNLHIEQHLSAVILRFSCFKKAPFTPDEECTKC